MLTLNKLIIIIVIIVVIMIIYCYDVAKRDPFRSVLLSPEKAVFLLLVHHFTESELTPCTLNKLKNVHYILYKLRNVQPHVQYSELVQKINCLISTLAKATKQFDRYKRQYILVSTLWLDVTRQDGSIEKPKLFWGKQLYYAGEDILAAAAESVVDINILLSWYIIH